MNHSFSFCAVESEVKLVEGSVGEESENIQRHEGTQMTFSQEVSSK